MTLEYLQRAPLLHILNTSDCNHGIGVRYPLGAGASVSSLEFDPPNVKIGDSAGLSGARIGFVLVWSARGFTRECDPIEEALHRQLAAGYQLVCSSPRGLARLYRRL